MAASNFDAIYDAVLKSEGGLSTRTAATGDPGGRTMQGITQGTYNTWRAAQGLPSQDVIKITPTEHRTITRTEYWDKIRGDDLPSGLDYSVFDTAFNAGPGRAATLLQRSLGLAEDGNIGPNTILAAQTAKPSELLGQFTANRRSTYQSFKNAGQNPGWWPRINDVSAASAEAIKNGGFGAAPIPIGYDPSQFYNQGQETRPGPGDFLGGGDGNIGNSGRPVETGSGTGFTGIDASGNVGPGSNNLGGATPLGPPPGPYDFANGGTPGGIGDPNFGGGIGGPSLTPTPTLDAPAGTNTIANLFQSILGRPADAQTLGAFDAELDSGRMDLNAIQAALRGSEEAKTLGPLGEAKTYSPLDTVYARQFDRAPDAAAVQNWGNVNGSDIGALEAQLYGSQEAQTYRAGLGDLAGLISPGTAPTIGAGPAAGTIGSGGLAGMIGADPAMGTLGPTPNQSITATPGIGEYDFASNYLRANGDVAAAGMNPWEHFLRYGAQEGRAFNTAGDKFDASRYLSENADVQQAGQDALTHYLSYGAAEGRDAPIIGANGTTRDIGSLGLTPTITASLAQYLQPQGTAPTIGPQQNEFSGSFDGDAYLRQNGDVAQAGMDPLQHYLKYGFAEGRAINPGGAHINQAFDPSAYLQANPDVAAAKLDPLAHYLLNGASEGRAAPTGSNPYSFSNFNVSQGLGPVGPGAFGLSGVTGGAGSPMPSFGGQNVSQGVPNGSFGSGISPYQTISPFGFSGANVSGGLGATAQSLGGSYGVTSAMDLGLGGSGGGAGSSGDGTISPYGFGGDVSGFDVNGGGGNGGGAPSGSTGFDDGSMAAAGFDEKGSELAFLRGQEQNIRDMNESAKLFGQQITNVAPGNQTNYALGAINTPIAPIQQTPFTPVNMSGVFAPMPTAMFMPRFTF